MPYTVRFPFQLTKSDSLGRLDTPISRSANGLTFTLARKGEWLVLTASEIESQDHAETFVGRIWAGLASVLLERNIAFSASTMIDKSAMDGDPSQPMADIGFGNAMLAQGLVEGSIPSIFPTALKVRAITIGTPTVTNTIHSDEFLAILVRGALEPNSHQLPVNERVRTAIDLYARCFFEASPNARFLALVMALEALTTPRKKEQIVVDLLAEWIRDVDESRRQVERDSSDDHALEAISRELLFRQETSIRSRVREVVLETLDRQGKAAAHADAKRALAAYDARSVLIHEGTITPSLFARASTDAHEVLHKILTVKVSAITKAHGQDRYRGD